MDQLKSHLIMPSTVHIYSISTEFIRSWFLDNFGDEYFKTIHIEGKHVLDSFRKFDANKALKNSKPALAIVPQIQMDFNRDTLDSNMFGLHTLIQAGNYDTAFFKDTAKNIYIKTYLKQFNIKYLFKVRVETKAQQIDLAQFMIQAFRIGHNERITKDLDFHIPYSVMKNLAISAGFALDNIGNIADITSFLSYVNAHSELPIMFKLRTVNQMTEFFMRFRDIDINLSMFDQLNIDDGETSGMLTNNYHIEFEVDLKIAAPRMYVYYSKTPAQIEAIETPVFSDPIYSDNAAPIIKVPLPLTNSRGWEQLVTTEYYDDDLSHPLVVDFKGTLHSLHLEDAIDNALSLGLNPNLFIEFYINNSNNENMAYQVNWATRVVTLNTQQKALTSFIAIYVDTKYLHEFNISHENLNKNRLK